MKIERAYFWKEGCNHGEYPLDEELNLPEEHFSYLLQKWSGMKYTDFSFEKARIDIHEIFGIDIWSKQMEMQNRKIANSVVDFYDECEIKQQDEKILCIEIDGKGIVIIDKDKKKEKKIRLKRGEKSNTKKMAVITSVFGIDRNVRKIEDIVNIEGKKGNKSIENAEKMNKPVNKQIRGTLEGKECAFQRLKEEVNKRDPENRCDHVALVDGERALEKEIKKYFPDFTMIIDLCHVMERLWDLSYLFHAEGSKEAELFVRKYLIMILSGKVGYFIGAMKQIVSKKQVSKKVGEKIIQMMKYFGKRKNYMKYNEYLAKGYPIGTGVIEGACRSYVKDRMELSGMRWVIAGAESLLQLRSIKINGKWGEYWDYYRKKRKEDLYSAISNTIGKGSLDEAVA